MDALMPTSPGVDPPHDPELERTAIAQLLADLAVRLDADDGEPPVVSEEQVDLMPYDSGIGPSGLWRLEYQADLIGVAPDAQVVAEFLVERGFRADASTFDLHEGDADDSPADPGADHVVEAHNEAGALAWFTWAHDARRLTARFQLPPATYTEVPPH